MKNVGISDFNLCFFIEKTQIMEMLKILKKYIMD